MIRAIAWLPMLCCLLWLQSAQAASLVAIVSPRNGTEVAAGARQFLQSYPQHGIQLRTTDQFAELTPIQQQRLINGADVVFAGGVFGTAVEQLLALENNGRLPDFIAAHSDRRLVKISQLGQQPLLKNDDLESLMHDPPWKGELRQWIKQYLEQHADNRRWLLARLFWAGRGGDNMEGLFAHLFSLKGVRVRVPVPEPLAPLRGFYQGKVISLDNLLAMWRNEPQKRWVVVLDYETGDRPGEADLLEQLCRSMAATDDTQVDCLGILATWGAASIETVRLLQQHQQQIPAVISLQNFIIGGGEGHETVNKALKQLGMPVLKGIRLNEKSELAWQLSEDGLSWNSVHYRVAMPELQGIIEPMVLSVMTQPQLEPQTGIRLTLPRPLDGQVALLTKRLTKWLTLQQKANHEKRIAIVYYNHPPGRHNIGADNLNVPATLFDLLHHLKNAGYDTGELPVSQEALLDMLQARGVNLPEDGLALSAMAQEVVRISARQYKNWFDDMPVPLREEMTKGPLGYLHGALLQARMLEDKTIAQELANRVLNDLRHAIDGAAHPSRNRALKLLDQLAKSYADINATDWSEAGLLVDAIAATGVEGLRGWGEPPGQVMVHHNEIILPGIRFGNVFVGPQPPRGWELNEELLHANLSFPPTHQYLAFYQWLQHGFKADALVHLGRHSTYEFLPRHRVGLGANDYPTAILGDLPSLYPYIVDGVGEGIQAKRRGLGVMIDHLTPPLESTELYDQLLNLRQLVESYEAAQHHKGPLRQQAVNGIKMLVEQLKLKDELIAGMSSELAVRGISEFDQINDQLLVHEVGHYLTRLQEDFMPLGLHVFGRPWRPEALDTMLASMQKGLESAGAKPQVKRWRKQLMQSPANELTALLNGLAGRYVPPGKGNDPIRTPEALPTGRNFYALDGSLIPSPLGYRLGAEMAHAARKSHPVNADRDANAIVLWASDAARDEGAMIAFGFDMLGMKPVWNSRGNFIGLERLPIREQRENGQPRRRKDVLFTTSGLFRDLYSVQLVWLHRAVLMAIDASSSQIRNRYPALTLALNRALEPLGPLQHPGDEPLNINLVAARWVEDARVALQQGLAAEKAGREATYRVFGAPPGAYGAGINRMVERSGSWQQRTDLGQVYVHRMGHVYTEQQAGSPNRSLFKQRLTTVGQTYLGRASHLYGLLDNNDSFDYLGGLSLAVETVTGHEPDNFIVAHPDDNHFTVEPLQAALRRELRGRYLNPQWLRPLMDEGYAGARTMGSEFLEYLWGWQVTNPGVVKSWIWDEVKRVYLDDGLELGLDEFLEQGHNVHVKSNMMAILLVAAQKNFWQADEEIIAALADEFVEFVLANGLPGSGHTNPDHPLFQWLKDYVSAEKFETIQQMLAAVKTNNSVPRGPTAIAELNLPEHDVPDETKIAEKEPAANEEPSIRWLALVALLLFALGWYRGQASPRHVERR